jgi:hypothetical protein
MALVVTGLSQSGDVSGIHKALEADGIATDSLQVIAPDDSTQGVSRGLISADLLTHDSGTSVPGINYKHEGGTFFRNETLSDRLGDLEIPDDEVENYVEALERGKYVVAYFAHPDTIDKVEEVFKASNLANVRRF